MKTWGISTVRADADGKTMHFAGYVIREAETAHEALAFANSLVTGVSYLVDELSPLVQSGLIPEDYDRLLTEEDWKQLKIRAATTVIGRLASGGQS